MRLIEDWWHKSLRLWSVRINLVWGILATVLAANVPLLLGLIAFMPNGPLRYAVAGFVGFVVFIVPTLARLMHQEKLAPVCEDKPDAE